VAFDHDLRAVVRPDERARPAAIFLKRLPTRCRRVARRLILGNGDGRNCHGEGRDKRIPHNVSPSFRTVSRAGAIGGTLSPPFTQGNARVLHSFLLLLWFPP